jgi:hypothetical protein
MITCNPPSQSGNVAGLPVSTGFEPMKETIMSQLKPISGADQISVFHAIESLCDTYADDYRRLSSLKGYTICEKKQYDSLCALFSAAETLAKKGHDLAVPDVGIPEGFDSPADVDCI